MDETKLGLALSYFIASCISLGLAMMQYLRVSRSFVL